MTELQHSDAHQRERDQRVPSTLTERFFGRMGAIGLPFQIYLDVMLDGQIDRAALEVALHRTIEDHPRLRVRLTPHKWGLRRRVEAPNTIDAGRLIRYHASTEELDLHRGDALDLAGAGPIRLDLLATDTTTRLVIGVHHAMTDAHGALVIYDRLAARYAEACGGEAPPPVTAASDPRRRRLLDGVPMRVRFAAAGSVLSPLREVIPMLRAAPMARFHDEATAEGSTLHTRHHTISPALVALLVRAGARRTASLNDLLVAAITVAALEAWPQSDGVPIGIDVPVSLRDTLDDVSDRAAPFRFPIPAQLARDFDATLTAVCAQTRAARTRTPSIVQSFGSTLPSYLPLAMFDGGVGGFMRANPTGGDSLCVSNVGALSGRPRDFGALPLTDAFVYANAAGLRVMVMPSPRGLQLTFSYFAPLVADHKVERIIERVAARLQAIAAQTAPTAPTAPTA